MKEKNKGITLISLILIIIIIFLITSIVISSKCLEKNVYENRLNI